MAEGHVIDHRRRRGQGSRAGHPEPGSWRSPVALTRASRSSAAPRRSGPQAGEMYQRVFGELGRHDVPPIHATTRPRRTTSTRARGARFDGRVPDRRQPAAAVLDDRRHATRRRRSWNAIGTAAVVAGTSAGASRHEQPHGRVRGQRRDAAPADGRRWPPGLGILPGVIVDQHFQQRNRLGRLLAIIAQNPSLLWHRHRRGHRRRRRPRHGDGGHRATQRDHRRRRRRPTRTPGRWRAHRPIMISNVVLHSLPAGYRFDLRRRVRLASPTAACHRAVAGRVASASS